MTSPVELRAETEGDEDALYRIAAELDTWEQRTARPPGPLTLAAFREQRAKGGMTGDADFVVVVNAVVAGRATLFHEDPLARTAEVGISLLPDARGKGHGTAAIRALIEFGFVRRNLRRLHLAVLASNAPAISLYRKLGFVEEGRRREHCWVRGRYEDEILMGLLRSEWSKSG